MDTTPEIAPAIEKLERVWGILVRTFFVLGFAFILVPYGIAAIRQNGPSFRDGRVYPYQLSLFPFLHPAHQVVYLTKTEDLLVGPVRFVLFAAFAAICIFVGFKLRKLGKRRDEAK